MCGSSWTGATATAAHHIQALPDSTDAGRSAAGLISILIPLAGLWSIQENAGRDQLPTDLAELVQDPALRSSDRPPEPARSGYLLTVPCPCGSRVGGGSRRRQ